MSLYNELFDYQRHIVDEFRDRNAFGLFLDMGLGKTPTSLAFAEVNQCTKVLIITINAKAEESRSIKDSWLGWASHSTMNYNFFDKWSKEDFNQNNNELLIVNYESLFSRKKDAHGLQLKWNIEQFIRSCKGHKVAIIVDESHKMKNLQSMQTKSILLIQKKLRLTCEKLYTYLLTGTPFTQGYIDLYTQLKALGYPETKTYYIDNFCVRGNVPGLLGWQQPIAGYKNLTELYRTIHRYAITIKSEDVIDLPEQIFVDHLTDKSLQFDLLVNEKMPGMTIYNELMTRDLTNKDVDVYPEDYHTDKKINNPFYRNMAFPQLKWIADTTGVFWLRARQLSIGFQGNAGEAQWYDKRRLEEIKTFLENNEDNYIIFYNYTPELLELFEICNKLDYSIDVYCGEVKSLTFFEEYSNMTEEQKLVNKKRVILANFASGSTGMNWQQYNKVIIASTPLYKDYAQALKRVHRPGQKETVIYHLFYQQNWLDYSMMNSLKEQTDYNQDMFEADLQRINRLLEKPE